MSAYALMICLALVGQVGTGGSRYTNSPTTVNNPFNQGGAATGSPAAGGTATGNTGGTVPANDTPPAGSRAFQGAAVPSGSANPYAPSSSPIGGRNASPPTPPFGDSRSSASPPLSTNPWATSAPAGGNSQTTPGRLKPSGMMRAMLVAPRDSRLTGSRIALADVVATASSRLVQAERVEAYWDLCSSVADYYLGLHEQEELRRLRTQLPRVGAAWQQAEKELANRVGTSQKAAVAAQYRLASLIGSSGPLPLPADTPHCADYYTHYDRIFASRPSLEAQELASLLPLRLIELRDAAAAVTRAEDWLETTATRSDTTEGVETLRALELLALRRRAFVQIARDYNRRIARYTELSTPGDVGAVRLVSMLIKPAGSSTATGSASPTPPTNRHSQVAPSPPPTFAVEGDWSASSDSASSDNETPVNRDDAVQPTSGVLELDPRRTEKSLLVNPPQ